MVCNKCGAENAPVKKCCSECGAILEGFTFNNVTGKFGYRHADGSFTVLLAPTHPREDLNSTADSRSPVKWDVYEMFFGKST